VSSLETPAVRRPSAVRAAGAITHAAWLAEDVLVLAGWLDDAERGQVTVVLERRDGTFVDVDVLAIPQTAERRTDAKVMLVRFPHPVDKEPEVGRLVRRAQRRRDPFGPADVHEVVTDLKTLLREAFAWLDPEARAAVLEFLTIGTADHGHDGVRLSDCLHRTREALRERLPRSKVAADSPHIVHVDAILELDERAFYIEGWVQTDGAHARLAAVSPEGARVDLTDRLFTYPRPDVVEFLGLSNDPLNPPRPGFICYCELPAPSRRRDGWILELHASVGAVAVETHGPRTSDDGVAAREMILGDLPHERLPGQDLRKRHILPAVTRLQERLRTQIGTTRIEQYGTPPEAPEISVIVPLYRRLDFLEHQLAQFVHDPEMHRADLLYVLDSPADAEEITSLATQLHRLYEVPFRVVVLDRNAGFSTVNNVGASLARGRLLLLLNSDVLPDRPGWLGQLRDFYDATPGVGAVSPKLLYEDGSIQHAGLFFDRPEGAEVWSNEHFFKGLAGSLPAANVARPVPAVTGACLMISRDLYEQMGGLRGIYVQGDYEDSDLCLRLLEVGRESWYLPSVHLYHLEAQSYPNEARRVASAYNAWVHTAHWDERIATVMAEFTTSTHRGTFK